MPKLRRYHLNLREMISFPRNNGCMIKIISIIILIAFIYRNSASQILYYTCTSTKMLLQPAETKTHGYRQSNYMYIE